MFIVECPVCSVRCTLLDESEPSVTCPSCGSILAVSTDRGMETAGTDFLPQPHEERLRAEWDAPTETTSDSRLPEFPRYVPRRILGRGGFATVYLADDTELNRVVALKVPHKKFGSASELLREARVAVQLRHPSMVSVLDVVRTPDERWLIVSEFIDGDALSQVLRRGQRFPPTHAARLMVKIAQALHYLHKSGFVHRDVKPGNILIRRDGEPFLADLGIALHEETQTQSRGDVAGTLFYMAPEQIRGRAHQLDGRTDEWAFGCVLYELLTGRRPFESHPSALSEEICQRDPKPPRQRSEAVPRELEQICLKCLSKNVTDRYPAMLDVAEALQHWLDSDAARLTGAPATPRRMHRTWTLAISASLLLLVAFSAMGLSMRRGADYQIPVESSIQPGRWHNLPLDGARPRPVIFSRDLNRARWAMLEDPPELIVDSLTDGLIGLGRTQAKDFACQIQMSRAQWNVTTQCGIFLGYKPGKHSDGRDGFLYQTVWLDVKRDGRAFATRTLFEQWFEDGVSWANAQEFKYQQVALHATNDVLLEVQVRGGGVSSVQLQGMELFDLTDPREGRNPVLPDCTGEFGVANAWGATRFHDCRFRLLTNEGLAANSFDAAAPGLRFSSVVPQQPWTEIGKGSLPPVLTQSCSHPVTVRPSLTDLARIVARQ